jgi:hypothetical protein
MNQLSYKFETIRTTDAFSAAIAETLFEGFRCSRKYARLICATITSFWRAYGLRKYVAINNNRV